MIVTIDEHQHINNGHVCSFCGDARKRVTGRAYSQSPWDYPAKHYLFSYCEECGLLQASKMAKVVHPKHEVV